MAASRTRGDTVLSQRIDPARRLSGIDTLKSVALVVALVGISAFVGYFLFGVVGLFLGALLVLVMGFVFWQIPDEWVMRVYGAQRLVAGAAPELHAIVRELAANAGLPMPTVYFIPSSVPNAAATRSSHGGGALAVTAGALNMLSTRELRAILAHEMAHLRSRDTRILQLAGIISQVVISLIRAAVLLTFVLMLMYGEMDGMVLLQLAGMALVIPIVVGLLQAALSRTREFAADRISIDIAHDPEGLAAALAKLSRYQSTVRQVMTGGAPGSSILRSHPSVKARIARLEALVHGT